MKKGLLHRISESRIRDILSKLGLILVDYNDENPITDGRFKVRDKDGYTYLVYWSAISKGIFPSKFYNSNPFTIQNINRFLTIHRDGEYVCVSRTYSGNNSELEFVHLKCMKHFKSTLAAMQGKMCKNGDRYYKQCPFCNKRLNESRHASILKQIFIHEYSDTVVEDRSCINPVTNRALPTDIVNHSHKIAVEIQSDYHDDIDQKKVDEIKRNYWIDRGYSFYALDIRDYKVIDMINIFFPNIHSIPDYINYEYSTPTNPKEIQLLLNDGLTIKEASDKLNITVSIIHNMVANGTVNLPEYCKRKAISAKTLVHLSKTGEFIKEYEYLNYVSNDGYALGTIQRVLKGKQKYAYDSLWIYGEDYHNGNYIVPEIEQDKYDIPIHMEKEGIKTYYNSIYEASKHLSLHLYEIYDVLSGKNKTVRGYKVYYA